MFAALIIRLVIVAMCILHLAAALPLDGRDFTKREANEYRSPDW
jgi:hypothetical protein